MTIRPLAATQAMPAEELAKLAAGDLWAIDVRGVEKTYRGKVRALRGVDMAVRRGEVFGLLGPNGAGKSTLVKVMMTVIRADRAGGHMLGAPVGHKPTLGRVGYLPEHHRFPEYLTGAQVLDLFGAMSGVPRKVRKERAGWLLEFVGMSAWAGKPVRSYSTGMRQRVGIAQALMNDPDLVILDEPTDGVDPVGRRDIREMMQTLRSRGKSVLINSHILSELETLCDRVAIMVQGRVATQGTISDLTSGRERFELTVEGDAAVLAEAIAASGGRVAGSEGVLATGERVTLNGATASVYTGQARALQPVIDATRARGGTIASVRALRPTLEDLFMEAVTDPDTGGARKPGAAQEGA